jgi:predicted transcriptional regulator
MNFTQALTRAIMEKMQLNQIGLVRLLLSRGIHVTQATVSHYVRGNRGQPRWDIIVEMMLIANEHNISVIELFDEYKAANPVKMPLLQT